MITSYQRSDAAAILRTIQKLFADDVFKKHLNPSQLLLLKYLLSLPDQESKTLIWDAFLSGKLELFVELNTTLNATSDKGATNDLVAATRLPSLSTQQQPQASSGLSRTGTPLHDSTDNQSVDDDDSDMIDLEQLKAQLDGLDFIGNLSMKVRYVVWEHGLTLLEPETSSEYLLLDTDNDSAVIEDGSNNTLIDQSAVPNSSTLPTNDTAPLTMKEVSKNSENKEGSDEDDNYDEDDDDDDEDNYDDAEEDPQKIEKNDTENGKISHPNDLDEKPKVSDETESPIYEQLDNGLIRLHFIISKETLNELPSVNTYDIIGNFHKIYHLFDNDKETTMRRLKLQENDQMLESSRKRSHEQIEDEEEDDSGNPSISHHKSAADKKINTKTKADIQMDLGVVNLSLRHLLKSVQENKSKLDISDYELKHLLMDVRMNRSKWASEDKIGQEELYDACEKVVLELRNFTEHSTAFLNKVSKREAPNYYQIIKKPMDLNTVLKKLKTFQYKSKHEFVDDIMLIWRNCLTYNSDPKHFLRAHAIAMQKKSQQLVPLIPDITIRDRAQVEKELEDIDAESNIKDDEEDAGSGRKGIQRRGVQKVIDDEEEEMEENHPGGKKTRATDAERNQQQSTNKTVSSDKTPSTNEAEQTPEVGIVSAEGRGSKVAQSSTNNESTEPAVESKAVSTVEKNQEHEDAEEEEEEEDEDEEDNAAGMMLLERDDDKDDLELSTWKTLTAKARAEICLKRSQLFNEHKINSESDALLKNPSKLKNFDQFFEEYKQQKEAEFARQKLQEQSMMKNGFGAIMNQADSSVSNFSDTNVKSQDAESSLTKESNEITLEDSSLLTEYNITNYIPDLAYTGIGKEQLDKAEEAMVQKIMKEGKVMKSSLLNTVDKGLSPKMNTNIQLIHEIRHICHKISLIRALQNPNKPKNSQQPLRFKEFIIDDSLDLDPISQLNSHDYKNDEKLINRVLHRNVSKITMSNGFESTEPLALSMLTEITTDYLSNLIKTIKLHHETHSSNKRKPAEALTMALLENGINKPDDLYSYMENEFGKKTRKLEDLKVKLSSFLKDLLRPTLQDISERNFEDESQSFLTGDFSSEVTGEDFFGFRELGLDKEFGELANNVPLQLLTFQFNGKDTDIQVKAKVIQPEEFEDVIYKKLNKENVQSDSYSKLIQPLLQSAVDRCSAYYTKLARSKNADQVPKNYESPLFPLLEDEEFPKVKGANRPRLPPTGKISTNYKKKHVSELYTLPEEEEPQVKVEVSEDTASKPTDGIFKSPATVDDNGFYVEETPLSSFSLSLPGIPDT
ncbi:SAGA histone acetyltransferase complex subunit SPT7 [Kluyveromyces lactis]|uniref:SAGA complex subunit Spt7 n=1 Tax=Kluyveromyces lactis (strain ATCC 8585 / CBS 2359 / DSM 70799 / NBRC 1267 / NRRL Y-1140 / WM37) TaxID=284590 RepID=Q6CNH2_KLULA|nr:uncharacterized protein KLLA0_E12585g [Kluyveromyces lactis]CAG99604.1 KLLA0E12585p [Kluyveromyces lactis]|eukprot:XP_454517.1 uncharacterized protein KLLA0_E12585g [Kluyveromyces lactis]